MITLTEKALQRAIECPIYALYLLKDCVINCKNNDIRLYMGNWGEYSIKGDNGSDLHAYMLHHITAATNRSANIDYFNGLELNKNNCSLCAGGSLLYKVYTDIFNIEQDTDDYLINLPNSILKLLYFFDRYRKNNKTSFYHDRDSNEPVFGWHPKVANIKAANPIHDPISFYIDHDEFIAIIDNDINRYKKTPELKAIFYLNELVTN